LLSEQSARTYIAQEIALGRAVMVHYLDRLPVVDNQRLIDRLNDLPTYVREKIVEMTEVDGITVVVTLFIAPFHGLQAWLDRIDANRTNPQGIRAPGWNVGSGAAGAAASPKLAQPSAPLPSAPAPATPTAPPVAPAIAQAPSAAPAPHTPAGPKRTPGDFTRIFGAQDITPAPSDAPVGGAATLPPSAPRPMAPPPMTPPPVAPSQPPPSFAGPPMSATPAADPFARSAPPPVSPPKPPESFTSIFGAPQLPSDALPLPKPDLIVPPGPAAPPRRAEPSAYPPSLNDFGGFERSAPPPPPRPMQPPLPPMPSAPSTPAPRTPIAQDVAGIAGAAAAGAAAPAAAAAAAALANKNQQAPRTPMPPLPDPGLAASAGAGLIGSAGVGSAIPRPGMPPSVAPRVAQPGGLPPGPLPPAAPLGGAPSDYTRVVRPNTPIKQAPPVSPGVIKPATGSPQVQGGAAAGGQRDWLPVVIGLGVILLVAIGLVIYLLLRHK
jgi:hypothetical protein